MSGVSVDRSSKRIVLTLTYDEAADIGRFLYEEGGDDFGKVVFERAREAAGWGDVHRGGGR